MQKKFDPHVEWLASQIVDIAIKIHKRLGPGLLESVYEKVFCHELRKRGIPYQRQKQVPIVWDEELVVEEGLGVDILVDGIIHVELKARENPHPVWTAQILSYLRLTNKELGFLINFHVVLMKEGIKRLVL
jgi:GxxExxY protein